MILYIDTTDYHHATFALKYSSPLLARHSLGGGGRGEARRGWKMFKKSYKTNPHNSHQTLQKLDDFLKSAKLKPSPGLPPSSRLRRADRPPSPNGRGAGVRVTSIVVNKGPGSFTGIRVAAAHALALSLAWKVPMKFVAKEKFILLA